MNNEFNFENPFPEPFEIEITDSLDLHAFSPQDVKISGRNLSERSPQKRLSNCPNNSRQRHRCAERNCQKSFVGKLNLSKLSKMRRNFRAVGVRRRQFV